MIGRATRWSAILCAVVALSLLTGCTQKDDGVDETLTIDQAKNQTQAVEERIIALVPPEFVAEANQQSEGVLLACSPTAVTWAGGATIVMQAHPDFAEVLADIQSSFDSDPTYTTVMESDTNGDPVLTVKDKTGGLWIVGPMKRGETLDISSSSPCFTTPDGMQPSDTY